MSELEATSEIEMGLNLSTPNPGNQLVHCGWKGERFKKITLVARQSETCRTIKVIRILKMSHENLQVACNSLQLSQKPSITVLTWMVAATISKRWCICRAIKRPRSSKSKHANGGFGDCSLWGDGLTTDHKGSLEWLRAFKHTTTFLLFGGRRGIRMDVLYQAAIETPHLCQLAKAPGRWRRHCVAVVVLGRC